ncbi:MAG: hypothetical protein EZS26_003528 [Candidatus Ordinivivax streblomastigis]|uniref:Uncharacterized protein n=1 Tax=Candidatus Ordinivivax streblomastigis TaxID=2540710 RepID=A0A5M8NY71_9BACT|nr:MAG: hypothetical protein EZS26_003528 [Candidatus Ordinivivax streblomastigis]
MEKAGMLLLVVACLFMACLNLWNLFKEWFDSKYQPRNENKGFSPKKVEERNDGIDKHIYIYKDKLKEKDVDLKNEFAALKQNEPFMSVGMEKEYPPNINQVHMEEETIFLETTSRGKENSESFESGITMDEFELVAKALRGKPINKREEQQAGHVITRIAGTELFKEFTLRVCGAQERAEAILNRLDNEDSNEDDFSNFDISRYIRVYLKKIRSWK